MDEVTGGVSGDTFTADLLTVTDGDTLDGGAGSDTLNAEINSAVTDKVTVANIENINVTSFGANSIDTKNMSGVETLTSKDSTGAITLNNLADPTVALGLEGSSTNDITANYTAGSLGGTSDALKVVLNTAAAVSVDVDAGFESATFDVSGNSDINGFTAPGITTVAVEGSGDLDFANTTIDGIKTLTATTYTGVMTTGTVSSTNGYVDADIVGSVEGASILLGSGNDSIGFTGATNAATKSNTVKLGAGDDQLVADVAGTGDTYIFGEAGNDQIRIDTTNLGTGDLIDGGAGTDTVLLNVGGANSLVLRSVENLNLTSTATGTQTINSSDTALNVTANVDGSAVDLADLVAGSTVKVQTESGAATSTAGAVSVGFKSAEASSTVDIESGMDNGALTLTNITNATVDLGAESGTGTASTVATTGSEALTINATGAYEATTVQATDDKLTSVTIAGTDAVATTNIGAATTDSLETVSATASKALSVGSIGIDSTKNTSVSLTSSTDAVTAGIIGNSAATGTLALTINAEKDITQTGAIDSTKAGNITIASTSGAIDV